MPSSIDLPHPPREGATRGTQGAGAATNDLALAWHQWADLSVPQLYELLAFRQAIFVVEQASPYPDLDGRDSEARHLTLRRGDALLAYLRLIAPNEDEHRPLVRIGRVAVAPDARGGGHARLVMDEALTRAAELYPGNDIEIGAQTYLEAFYRSFGFTPCSSPYDDFGVPHIDLVRRAGAANP